MHDDRFGLSSEPSKEENYDNHANQPDVSKKMDRRKSAPMEKKKGKKAKPKENWKPLMRSVLFSSWVEQSQLRESSVVR